MIDNHQRPLHCSREQTKVFGWILRNIVDDLDVGIIQIRIMLRCSSLNYLLATNSINFICINIRGLLIDV